MSTFSNWNGPSIPGTSLPQVRTLEELISQVRLVDSHIQTVSTQLDTHIKAALNGLHSPIQDDYNTKLNALRNEIGSVGSTTGRILEVLNAAKQYTDQQIGGTLPQGTVRNTVDALSLAIQNVNASLTATEARLNNTISTNKNAVDQTFTEMLQQTQTSLLKVQELTSILPDGVIDVSADLSVVGDLLLSGNIKLDNSIDFTNWATVQAQAVPDGSTTDNIVLLLGCLSKDWDTGINFPDAQRHKSATVYIKYVNSMPWNAIVNLNATIDYNAGTDTKYSGAIFGIVSKTATRDQLTFGVYRDTVPSGEERIYLGIKVQETIGHAIAGQSFTSYTFNVAGINFEPLTPALRANSSVKEIAITNIKSNPGGVILDPLSSSIIFSDNYMDQEGHGVAVTDEVNSTLTIGELHKLILYSSDRPDVISGGSFERMAFLSDLTTSVKWQRAVTVVAANKADLDGLLVTVDLNNIPQPWNPSGTNKPGVYTSDKNTVTPNAILFASGDSALVEDSGQVSAPLADGLYNGTFASLTPDQGGQVSVPMAACIGLDVDHIKQSATPTNPAITDGTVLIDTSGAYAKVNVVNQVTQAYQCVPITGTPVYLYTEPSYYTFDGTAWSNQEVIAVPGNEAKHISNISYQWSGMALDNTGFFANAYVIWTPSYQNETTMAYTPEQLVWSNNIIVTPNMRTANEQDQIDMKIVQIATVQPDYAENQETITSPLDGTTIPNPAFIQNKLLIGMSLADGGVFSGGEWNNTWLLDGGDLTEVWKPNFTSPVINTQQQFQNVVIRLWRGTLSQMLEVYDHATNTWSAPLNQWVWSTYKYVPRYVTDTQEFMISNGVDRIIRFIPWDNYKSSFDEVMQYTHLSATSTAFALTFEATNFGAIGTPQFVQHAFNWSAPDNTLNFALDTDTNVVTITSQRMDDIDTEIANVKDDYLQRAGGIMTGPLDMGDQEISNVLSITSATAGAALDGAWTVNANVTFAEPLNMGNKAINNLETPTGTNDAATKGYVDAEVATALPLVGGTLTGALTLAAEPTTDEEAATKKYVDDAVDTKAADYLPLAGGALTGTDGASITNISSLGFYNNDTITAATTGLTINSIATIMEGTLSMSNKAIQNVADPVDAQSAATKNYVDTAVSTLNSDITTLNSAITTLDNSANKLWGVTVPELPTTGGPYTLQYNVTTGEFAWV